MFLVICHPLCYINCAIKCNIIFFWRGEAYKIFGRDKPHPKSSINCAYVYIYVYKTFSSNLNAGTKENSWKDGFMDTECFGGPMA